MPRGRVQPPAPRIFTPEYYARMRELESLSWWNAGMRDTAAMLLERASLPEKGAMLDAGCGSGQTMSWFQQTHPAWSVTGIDVAPEGLAVAESAGLSVRQASVLEIPFEPESFDLVVTLDVLQHLPLDGGDATALAEFARVLRPGGTLLIRTNAQAIPRVADDREFSFRKYEPLQLRERITAAGFETMFLGRANALLGLAEIPRELMAKRRQLAEYHGILAEPTEEGGVIDALCRRWLALEGRALAAGWQLPFGRTIFALCRVK
ncbi:MAG: class I SAM-dependent methyltransferase [Gemmatimonadales bacterium]